MKKTILHVTTYLILIASILALATCCVTKITVNSPQQTNTK